MYTARIHYNSDRRGNKGEVTVPQMCKLTFIITPKIPGTLVCINHRTISITSMNQIAKIVLKVKYDKNQNTHTDR